MWYCRSFYKGNSCNHYSYSYVIIWYVKHLYTVQARGTFIHPACQYIYFPLLVLFLFAAVKQSMLSIQLVFLGADKWLQKERYTRIIEISTLQDLVQRNSQEWTLWALLLSPRGQISQLFCVQPQSRIRATFTTFASDLSFREPGQSTQLCAEMTHLDKKEVHSTTGFPLSIQAPWVSVGMQASCIWHYLPVFSCPHSIFLLTTQTRQDAGLQSEGQ